MKRRSSRKTRGAILRNSVERLGQSRPQRTYVEANHTRFGMPRAVVPFRAPAAAAPGQACRAVADDAAGEGLELWCAPIWPLGEGALAD